MKRIYLFLSLFIPIASHALVAENVVDGCDDDILGFTNHVVIEAVFEPASYTCPSGQYLPIATAGCVICPSEATCSGGTYTFNEIRSQGVVYNNQIAHNKTKGCESNLLGVASNVVIEAVFEPKTVALTYNDGNGNTTSGSCTYDGLISLSPELTRPGYTFTGWAVQNNNN